MILAKLISGVAALIPAFLVSKRVTGSKKYD